MKNIKCLKKENKLKGKGNKDRKNDAPTGLINQMI